jgi:iron-sulfur cluster assembly protein
MIEITPNAARHIRRMLAKRNLGETGLRLGVKAGGCSGFEYTFGWAAEPRPGDAVFEGPDGARVFVDPRSLRLLDGTVLDYDTSLLSRGFVLNNPNAKSTCGCGVSFNVELPAPDPPSPNAGSGS